MIRKPAVAGQFYSGSRGSLLKEVESLIDRSAEKEDAIGVVSPHAGYVYSGAVAGAALSSIKPKPTYIIMGPNHTGLGGQFSLSASDSFETPLGEVKIDKILKDLIKKNSRYIKEDEYAHSREHSIEVQLPFLQILQKDFGIVPIVISYADIGVYQDIGRSIANAIKELKLKKDITIIASSDMTHYEPYEIVKEKDSKAIEAILELDENKLVDRIDKLNISMCGYAPCAILLVAAKELGAKKAKLIKYQTSGEASGDYSSVVGYAGVRIV